FSAPLLKKRNRRGLGECFCLEKKAEILLVSLLNIKLTSHRWTEAKSAKAVSPNAAADASAALLQFEAVFPSTL
ncbi:MAG: hypothetical protein SOS94_10320, partial [Lachnospiraceae bacterium]|nr:hypothetical protein [Lachnospiraceae bacterium]